MALGAYTAHAQKLKEMTTSAGITYRVGDKLQLVQGSAGNGDFIHIMYTPMMAQVMDGVRVGYQYNNLIVTIKKIKYFKRGDVTKLYLSDGLLCDIELARIALEIKKRDEN